MSKNKKSRKKRVTTKRISYVFGLCFAFFLGTQANNFLLNQGYKTSLGDVGDQIEVFFSPKGGTKNFLRQKICQAKKSILLAMYNLTCPELATELIKAHDRGVIVKILSDKTQKKRDETKKKGPEIPRLKRAGIPVRISKKKTMHHKFAVIDDNFVVTGSYNWTENAENYNEENVLSIPHTNLCNIYTKEFEKRFNDAKPL